MFTLRLTQSENIGCLVYVDHVCSEADRFCFLDRLDQNLQADVGKTVHEMSLFKIGSLPNSQSFSVIDNFHGQKYNPNVTSGSLLLFFLKKCLCFGILSFIL